MFTKIRDSFWTDQRVCSLSDRGKLAYLYLMSSPHRNILGLYRLPVAYMACDLGWGLSDAMEAIDSLVKAGFVVYDRESGYILIRRFLKHNRLENPNQIKAAMARLKELEGNPLLPDLLEALRGIDDSCLVPIIDRLETLSEGLGNSSGRVPEGLPNKEEEEEEEKEKEEEEEEEEEGDFTGPAEGGPSSPDGDHEQKLTASPRKGVPYQKIVDLYNKICVGLPRVVTITEERRRALSARWHTKAEFQSLEFWREFWERVWRADWLCGRVEARDGRAFLADFDWCVRPRNFTKIIEGKYDSRHVKSNATKNRVAVLAEKDPREILEETFRPRSLREEASFSEVLVNDKN